jgi:hypothetical protein
MTIGGRQKRINTDRYNIFNAMKCPEALDDGIPLPPAVESTSIKVTPVIQKEVYNFMNYAAAYPLSGVHTEVQNGEIKQTPNGPFYAGKDYALGSNYFMPLGHCNDKSEDNCKGKNRYVYIRNIPTGRIPLIGNLSFHSLTGCNIPGITEGRGLVPGMLEDLSDIQPLNLLDNLVGNGNLGNYKCKKKEYPVGTHIYDPKMKCNPGEDCVNKSWWMEKRCTPSYKYLKKSTSGRSQKFPLAKPLFELYKNYDKNKNSKSNTSIIIITILAIILGGYLCWDLFKKK